jgi:hypothetical protein
LRLQRALGKKKHRVCGAQSSKEKNRVHDVILIKEKYKGPLYIPLFLGPLSKKKSQKRSSTDHSHLGNADHMVDDTDGPDSIVNSIVN